MNTIKNLREKAGAVRRLLTGIEQENFHNFGEFHGGEWVEVSKQDYDLLTELNSELRVIEYTFNIGNESYKCQSFTHIGTLRTADKFYAKFTSKYELGVLCEYMESTIKIDEMFNKPKTKTDKYVMCESFEEVIDDGIDQLTKEEQVKEYKRAYMRAYRERNKEHLNELARERRAREPERHRAYIENYWRRQFEKDNPGDES